MGSRPPKLRSTAHPPREERLALGRAPDGKEPTLAWQGFKTGRKTKSVAAPGNAAALAGAIASVSIVGVGLSLTIALIAVRLGEQGYSARAIGLNTASAGVATLIGAAFVPSWARRLGVKELLFLSLFIADLSLAALALTNGFWIWLGIRAIFGLALTALFVVSEYWINAIAPPERRGLVIGLYASSVALGFAAGPSLLALVGTASSTPFIAAIALLAVAALPIVAGSSAAPNIKSAASVPVLAFLLGAPAATLAGLLHGAIETASMGLLPVYALRAGLTAETGAIFVTLFALGNVLAQLPVGFISDLMDRRKLLLLIVLFSLCGALALSLIGPASLFLFGALLVVWGGVVGSLYAVALAHLGAQYRGAELANANAAFVMLYALGMLAGPPVIGLGMDLLAPDGFFVSIAALLALYLCVVGWRARGS
ncbi:MFS transporter [Methylocapsa polymorpha]|uniref:MFS transporter n=1 Tax=Methylocapsa polymorpha TaxID=3080828 RepID=A0ABZ0HVY5_9HYPH|nr:MFS transporter [Methylocapsa sp. RX1]